MGSSQKAENKKQLGFRCWPRKQLGMLALDLLPGLARGTACHHARLDFRARRPAALAQGADSSRARRARTASSRARGVSQARQVLHVRQDAPTDTYTDETFSGRAGRAGQRASTWLLAGLGTGRAACLAASGRAAASKAGGLSAAVAPAPGSAGPATSQRVARGGWRGAGVTRDGASA